MISGMARRLNIGDQVVAIKSGYSDGVFYERGDIGTVIERIDDKFRVRFQNGKESAFLPCEKWEKVVDGNPTPETREYLEKRGYSFSVDPMEESTVDVSRLSGADYWRSVFGG